MKQISVWKRALNRVVRPSASDVEDQVHHHGNGVVPALSDLVRLRGDAKALGIVRHGKLMATTAGGFTSVHRGRGIDFEEVRMYQPGDDIRTMDWRVTARTGEPHTKVYRDERERPVLFFVGQGRTLRFGSRVCFKSVVAARVAALLAWMTVDNGDRIGGIVQGEWQIIELPPTARRLGALKLCNALCAAHQHADDVAKDVSLKAGIERLTRMARSGNVIFFITDFYEFDDDHERQLKRLAQTCEIVLVLVYDPLEMGLPVAGHYPITDGDHFVTLDLSAPRARDDYASVFRQRVARLRHFSRMLGAPIIQISPEHDLVATLRRGLPQSMM